MRMLSTFMIRSPASRSRRKQDPPCSHAVRPSRPTRLVALRLELPGRNVFSAKNELQIPRELEADVLPHQRAQLVQCIATGEQRRETFPGERFHDDAELVLDVPHRAPEDGAAAHAALIPFRQARSFGHAERHPVALELMHLHADAELQAEPGLEAVRVSRRSTETAREEQLRKVTERVALPDRLLGGCR